MSDFSYEPDDRDFESFDSLESIVRAAGGYVQPTDDLRPSTLEAAREACSQRRWNFRLGAVALVVIVLAIGDLPSRIMASRAGQLDNPSQAIRGYDLHQQASLRMTHSGFDSSWAVYEAFAELRKKQADLFDAAM
jgi:hypothetical protein